MHQLCNSVGALDNHRYYLATLARGIRTRYEVVHFIDMIYLIVYLSSSRRAQFMIWLNAKHLYSQSRIEIGSGSYTLVAIPYESFTHRVMLDS